MKTTNLQLVTGKKHLGQAEHEKYIEEDRVILNTIHFSVAVIETDEGIIIDVFHRNGDLIDTQTFWNDDVMEDK